MSSYHTDSWTLWFQFTYVVVFHTTIFFFKLDLGSLCLQWYCYKEMLEKIEENPKMNNPVTLGTLGTREEDKQNTKTQHKHLKRCVDPTKTPWWTQVLVDRYEISISQMTIPFHEDFFPFLYHRQGFHRIWLYIWVTQLASYKKEKLLTLREHLCSSRCFGGVHASF
jgi:hypothetical protein